MSLRSEISRALADARDRAVTSGALAIADDAPLPAIGLERPANPEHGDWASNVAMQLAPVARSAPLRIAETLLEHFEPPASVAKVAVAAPGFLNFHLDPSWVAAQVGPIRDAGETYGRGAAGEPMRINVEFLSANPTGPLHVGNARGAFVGDVLSRVLEAAGHEVTREYYFNDFGGQVKALGIPFDEWKTESSIHDEGWVARAVERLREAGYVYQSEGATWFRSTAFGDDRDRVIYRSNMQPTYFAADIGYVSEKFSRGFDELIYVWGENHHGAVARLLHAAEALGHDREAVRILLYSWVRFVRDGEAVSMSKRAGEFVTLDDLMSEVGADPVRWFFSSRAVTSGIDFDLELAKRQSHENPVYYVQYAHARASSIMRHATGVDAAPDGSRTADLLVHPSEQALIRHLLDLPDVVATAADRRETHEVPRFAYELAS